MQTLSTVGLDEFADSLKAIDAAFPAFEESANRCLMADRDARRQARRIHDEARADLHRRVTAARDQLTPALVRLVPATYGDLVRRSRESLDELYRIAASGSSGRQGDPDVVAWLDAHKGRLHFEILKLIDQFRWAAQDTETAAPLNEAPAGAPPNGTLARGIHQPAASHNAALQKPPNLVDKKQIMAAYGIKTDHDFDTNFRKEPRFPVVAREGAGRRPDQWHADEIARHMRDAHQLLPKDDESGKIFSASLSS